MQIKTTEVNFTVFKMALYKSAKPNCLRGCGKRKPSYTICGNVNWYNKYGKWR